jgi:hypothetical protein
VNEAAFLAVFPFAFIGLWLTATMALGYFSGWFSLQERYPDQDERPIDRLRMRSGSLGRGSLWNPWGAVRFNHCLRFDVCKSGLRIAVWRIFGVFQRPFFVPWSEIRVEEKKFLFMRMYRLNFGRDGGSALTVWRKAFERIAASSDLKVS